ncbi:O-antigen ligase family protein [Couchioplanes caeruleus]|uniref:O-antigen ligase family protein n=1 Tax=Couchioplanes caeruleus TaxID=56438 RepID=UPI0020BDE338|nr:O-antigen ligase family protein [Couchioplanes caeruleus]UQU62877.1 O-antigen ligase family protein [Couchioplanes caeruleus]
MTAALLRPANAAGERARGPVRRPSVLVAGTVLLICVPSRISDVSASGHITAADLGAGLVVAVIAVRLLGGDRSMAGRAWLPFGFALASFAVATVTASDVSASVIGFIRYSELFVLVPVAVAMSVRDRLDVFLVAGAIIAVTVVEGGVGVYQYLTRTGASYAGEYVRAVGTFGPEQVMALAALLGYGLVVTLALGLAMRGRARIGLLATAAFLLLPLGLTLSRGAWIATVCAVLVLLVVANWRVAVGLVGLGALGFAVLTLTAGGADPASGTFDQRITSIASSGSEPDQSVLDRYALWHAATAIWADHPVLGVGLKDFAGYRDSYASVALSAGSDVGDPTTGVGREPLLSAHNQYLMVLSEQGTVGILAFGTLLGTLAAGAVRRRESLLPPQGQRFLDLAAPALMVWTLVDFLYGDIGGGPSSVLLAVTLGLVARRGVVLPRPRPGGTP